MVPVMIYVWLLKRNSPQRHTVLPVRCHSHPARHTLSAKQEIVLEDHSNIIHFITCTPSQATRCGLYVIIILITITMGILVCLIHDIDMHNVHTLEHQCAWCCPFGNVHWGNVTTWYTTSCSTWWPWFTYHVYGLFYNVVLLYFWTFRPVEFNIKFVNLFLPMDTFKCVCLTHIC